jgi:hypothetical protein
MFYLYHHTCSTTAARGNYGVIIATSWWKVDTINRNANNVARVANSQLVSADDKLHPLLSLKNGRTLEKFPDTPKALAKLSGQFVFNQVILVCHWFCSKTVTVVDAMLSALEADRTGNEMEKREKLRLQIGLKANPA